LVRLLTEVEVTIEERPDILSRANFAKNYRPELRETAESDYDKLVGAEQQRVDVTFVRCDLDRFCAAAATETVREFVNKRAAHWDEAADPR
jgi:ABC-type hemin transport system ATPase subunit